MTSLLQAKQPWVYLREVLIKISIWVAIHLCSVQGWSGLAFPATRQFSFLRPLHRCLKCPLKLGETFFSLPFQNAQSNRNNKSGQSLHSSLDHMIPEQWSKNCFSLHTTNIRMHPSMWSLCRLVIRSGLHYLVKICQEKKITTHSWMHFRVQFPFVIGRTHTV